MEFAGRYYYAPRGPFLIATSVNRETLAEGPTDKSLLRFDIAMSFDSKLNFDRDCCNMSFVSRKEQKIQLLPALIINSKVG